MSRIHQTGVFLCVLLCLRLSSLEAATVFVAAGGDLQAALDAARPGDTILLQEGAEFVGSFVLPAKTGDQWITLRTAAPDTVLPRTGTRIRPSHAPLLARLRSPSAVDAALRTAPGAHHWHIAYLEFGANYQGNGDIVQIGDGSSAQDSLDKVPHHIVLSHLYIHGDPWFGQKRGIALNAAAVTIRDSHIADCKGVGQDTQAIGGWNGPGPYTIENNYLEAAGENVIFGGADPSIPSLVADGITFRGNYLSRPMAWRNPILRTPTVTTASREAGGSLPDGAYAYRIVAEGVARGTATPLVTIRSTASIEAVVNASGGASAIRIRWQAVSEDYTLRPGSVLKGGAPDGSDIGADFPTLRDRVQSVRTGDGPGLPNVAPVAAFTPVCVDLHLPVHRHQLGRRRAHRGTVVDVWFIRLEHTRWPDVHVRGAGHLHRRPDCDRR